VRPGSSVELARHFDPSFKAGIEKKKDGAVLQGGVELLTEYQARLAGQDTYGVLVALQALDAAGKDGTIRHVMSGVNPQGVRVESFKVPSADDLNHDFLRRYQEKLPSRGEIGIFNRSHYEEALVVRVHPENLTRQKLPPELREHHVWAHRYHAINERGAVPVRQRLPGREALPEPLARGAAYPLLLGSTSASGRVWNARSHAAYQGYSHLSGIETTSAFTRCAQPAFLPWRRDAGGAGWPSSPVSHRSTS
jgi:Polyphosphate kinase 2 (PPK2)